MTQEEHYWMETSKDWEAVVDALLHLLQAPPIEDATEPWGVGADGELILTDASPFWIEGRCGDGEGMRQVRIGGDSAVAAALAHLQKMREPG